jgi:prepilin-type N-terminal cleavage/methylation domain-containing protein
MRQGFTLIEVLVVLLVLALGLSAMIGVLAMANRSAKTAMARYTASQTAWSMIYDPVPIGLAVDIGDADGDGWRGTGTFSWTGSYTLSSAGMANGFYIVRDEVSTASDIGVAQQRWAQVTVEVYEGMGGMQVAKVTERILRQGAP